LLSVANPNPAPPPGIPPPTGTAAPPPGATGDEEIVDEHPTVIEVMVIHEVPIIEVTMIELPTGKSRSTMEGATGKTTHMATHATDMTTTHVGAESPHMAAKPATSHMATPAGEPATTATDRRNSAVNSTIISGANNVLEVRRACYRLS
jgi:hypothetical protein